MQDDKRRCGPEASAPPVAAPPTPGVRGRGHYLRALLIAALVMLWAGGASGAVAPQGYVRNGDFEDYTDEGVLSWETSGAVELVPAQAWQRLPLKFNSGKYRKLRLYLRLQAGYGKVWFDDVWAPGLKLADPGLEEVAEGRFVRWQQDEAGTYILPSDDRPHGGKLSLLIVDTTPGEHPRRVWQDVACEPNTEYEGSVFVRTEGFQGDAYAEMYGLNEDGSLGANIKHSPHVRRDTAHEHGRWVMGCKLGDDAPARLTQRLTSKPDTNNVVTVACRAVDVKGGQLALRVRAVGEEAPVLAELRPRAEAEGWQTLREVFQTGKQAELEVELTAQGEEGQVLFDNVRMAQAGPRTRPRLFRPGSASENWVMPEKVRYHVEADPSPVIEAGLEFFAEAAGVELVKVEKAEEAQLSLLVRSPFTQSWPKNQEFGLSVNTRGMRVVAFAPAGALYALIAAGELVDRTRDGKKVVLSGILQDRPDLRFRGTYIAATPALTEGLRAKLRQFARLRLNAVMFESEAFFKLDDEAVRQAAQECFAYCRSLGLEPIPELQSFGWAGIQLRINPNVAEGTFVEGERHKLAGTEPVALKHPNVIRTPSSRIRVFSGDGKTEYREGDDFRVVPGEMAYVYRREAKPFGIVRVAGGRIADGAEVLVSYDYVSRVGSGNCPYCPSEPLVYEIMRPALENTIKYLGPRYIHIGHDEPGQMNTDSRCRKRELSNAQLMAEDIKWYHQTVRAADPGITLMMWADALNPFHNGNFFRDDPTAGAAELIPRDIVQCVWFYGARDPLSRGLKSMEHFRDLGFAVTGSPWDNVRCARSWAAACYAAQQRKVNCLGTLYTSWDNRWGGLDEFARASWRVPKELLPEP